MPEDSPLVLRLEIDGGEEPLSGRLAAFSGPHVSFTGWLGLAAAIEQAMGRSDRAVTDEDSENTGEPA